LLESTGNQVMPRPRSRLHRRTPRHCTCLCLSELPATLARTPLSPHACAHRVVPTHRVRLCLSELPATARAHASVSTGMRPITVSPCPQVTPTSPSSCAAFLPCHCPVSLCANIPTFPLKGANFSASFVSLHFQVSVFFYLIIY